MKKLIAVLWASIMLVGCATTPAPAGTVIDPRGNLVGDPTRTYLDIVSAKVARDGEYVAFTVKTVSRFPKPAAMGGGKRVDYIWFVDADKNKATGQSPKGNDYNVHLYLDEKGWHSAVFPVSDAAKARNMTPSPEECQVRVEGTVATLLVPAKTFPAPSFDWWAWATTQNAPDWPPVSENPPTARAEF